MIKLIIVSEKGNELRTRETSGFILQNECGVLPVETIVIRQTTKRDTEKGQVYLRTCDCEWFGVQVHKFS